MKNLYLIILISLIIKIKSQSCSITALPNYTFYPNTTYLPTFPTGLSILYLCGTNTIVYDTISLIGGCRLVYLNAGTKYFASNISCSTGGAIYAKSNSTVVVKGNVNTVINYELGATIINLTSSALNSNSCSAISFPTVNCITSGIEELKIKHQTLKIYPNPTTSILSLEVEKGSRIRVINLFGELVKEEELKSIKQAIDISNLKTGIYFLQVYDKESLVGTSKIVKE